MRRTSESRRRRTETAARKEDSGIISVLDVREHINVYKSGELMTDWVSLFGAALRLEAVDRQGPDRELFVIIVLATIDRFAAWPIRLSSH